MPALKIRIINPSMNRLSGIPLRRCAIARMMSGQQSEAIAVAKEHLKQNPGDMGISALLGAVQILTKDYDGADATLTAALQITPDQRDIIQNLSALRRLQKRPADAAKLVDSYLAAAPSDGLFQFNQQGAPAAADKPRQN